MEENTRNNSTYGTAAIPIAFIALVMIGVTIYLVVRDNQEEPFMNYPKIKDALQSGWYNTFGRECKYYKCKTKDRYWCSMDKDCIIPEHHLKGELMNLKDHPWFYRFV